MSSVRLQNSPPRDLGTGGAPPAAFCANPLDGTWALLLLRPINCELEVYLIVDFLG